jgi:hypothetical protein
VLIWSARSRSGDDFININAARAVSKPGCTSGRLLHYTLGGDDSDDYYYYRISSSITRTTASIFIPQRRWPRELI